MLLIIREFDSPIEQNSLFYHWDGSFLYLLTFQVVLFLGLFLWWDSVSLCEWFFNTFKYRFIDLHSDWTGYQGFKTLKMNLIDPFIFSSECYNCLSWLIYPQVFRCYLRFHSHFNWSYSGWWFHSQWFIIEADWLFCYSY